MLLAVEYGSLEDIKKEHAKGEDIRIGMREYGSYTLMHVAAERRYNSMEEALQIMGYLRDQGLDLNARYLIPDVDNEVSCLQETPLIRAAKKLSRISWKKRKASDYYTIDALIKLGADVNLGFTEIGRSLFFYAVDLTGADDPVLAQKLGDAGANPFQCDANHWCPTRLYRFENPVYDHEKEFAKIIKQIAENANKKGLSYCDYDVNAVTVLPLYPFLMQQHSNETQKLKQFLIEAIVCNEDTQVGFRNLQGRSYDLYPMSLPTTYADLWDKGIHVGLFGDGDKNKQHAIREILKQIICELGTNPKVAGGIRHYDVRFGRNTTCGLYGIEFQIRSDYVADMRMQQKVANPGYASVKDGFIGAWLTYGLTKPAKEYLATGNVLPSNSRDVIFAKQKPALLKESEDVNENYTQDFSNT